jgi:ribonuclease VapC
MIVDSSAILAILLREPEADRLSVALLASAFPRMSAPNFLELSMVSLSRRGPTGVTDVDLTLARFRIQVAPFTESQVLIAREAFAKYGKGRHPAQLNFGDCIAYALATETGEELLFKGSDFGLTDVAVAPY